MWVSRKSPRMVEDADGEPQSRLTLQDSQPGSDGEENFVMEMGPIDGCPSGAAGLASGECTPLSPFASPAFQVRVPPPLLFPLTAPILIGLAGEYVLQAVQQI